MLSISRILVAACVVVLREYPRLGPEPTDSISSADGRAPGVDVVRSVVPVFADPFRRVIEGLQGQALEAKSVCLLILFAGLHRARSLDCHARLHAPQHKRFEDGIRNNVVNAAVRAINVVSHYSDD